MTSLLAVCLLATLSLILIMWRVLAVGLKSLPSPGENAPQHRSDYRLNLGFLNSYDAAPDNAGDRAKNYLRRVVALTSATYFGDGYVLDVGTNTFHVRERHVSRLQGATSNKRRYAQTCYRCPKAMPAAEKIATALLMLKNDPTLFDRWAAQNGAFKADGHEFKEPFFWFWNTPGP